MVYPQLVVCGLSSFMFVSYSWGTILHPWRNFSAGCGKVEFEIKFMLCPVMRKCV